MRQLPWLLAAMLLAGASLRPAAACSSFVVDCADGAVVSARTMDFPGDIIGPSVMYYIPAGKTLTGIPLTQGGAPQELGPTEFPFVAAGFPLPGRLPMAWDGMNSEGLGLGVLWQTNVSFHAAYDPKGPSTALPMTDGTNYLLGNFASVAEVKKWLQSGVQLTTNLKGDPIVDQLVLLILGSDPDVPKPDADGTQYMSVHVHITDKTGAGLLIEGTPNGSYALYDTQVLTNEPAWPLMTEWRDQWMAYNFSQVPGVSWFPYPTTGVPAVVPFNSAYDERSTGYLGSMSRYLRTWLAVQNCSAYPWPTDGVWSPGAANASVEPPPAEFKALKRAENWLGAVVVPRSQLVSNGGEFYEAYATQLSILRSYTDGVYYYKTPASNQWSSIVLGQLAERTQQVLRFPLGKQSSPFSIDRTPEGEPYKAAV